jgi:predicted transcriptional regulator
VVGVVSHESIRQTLRPDNLLRLRRVSDVMKTQVVIAPMAASVFALAQLMAEQQVSCVVITQPDEEDIERPVGIVTERDIVQFQAFQVNLRHTLAHTVMSTPLFLLRPEDSLWTAHQEMQKRRVGRLVVSWNWGQGLGIVTQTNLLRIFDPMEMYSVIENLQQTIQQIKTNQSPFADAVAITPVPHQSAQNSVSSDSIISLLDSAHHTLQQIIADPDLSIDWRQTLLQSVQDKLEKLDRAMRFQIDQAG